MDLLAVASAADHFFSLIEGTPGARQEEIQTPGGDVIAENHCSVLRGRCSRGSRCFARCVLSQRSSLCFLSLSNARTADSEEERVSLHEIRSAPRTGRTWG